MIKIFNCKGFMAEVDKAVKLKRDRMLLKLVLWEYLSKNINIHIDKLEHDFLEWEKDPSKYSRYLSHIMKIYYIYRSI